MERPFPQRIPAREPWRVMVSLPSRPRSGRILMKDMGLHVYKPYADCTLIDCLRYTCIFTLRRVDLSDDEASGPLSRLTCTLEITCWKRGTQCEFGEGQPLKKAFIGSNAGSRLRLPSRANQAFLHLRKPRSRTHRGPISSCSSVLKVALLARLACRVWHLWCLCLAMPVMIVTVNIANNQCTFQFPQSKPHGSTHYRSCPVYGLCTCPGRSLHSIVAGTSVAHGATPSSQPCRSRSDLQLLSFCRASRCLCCWDVPSDINFLHQFPDYSSLYLFTWNARSNSLLTC